MPAGTPPITPRQASTPTAQGAAAALLALSRAARSIVLYDAGNATVHHHLAEYQAKMTGFLQAHGTLAIAVAPFHLAVAGDVVYQDRDREKSLAFRLYRDGVRRLRILSHAPWEELLALLQILAVRYAAVREQEEDTVTLLRRAEFKAIELDSVEGFTPAEEIPEPESDVEIERIRGVRPPAGWDMPLQKLPAPGPLAYVPVPDADLAAFRDEQDEDAVVSLAISLASDLLAEATRGGWPMPNRDLIAFFSEVRDGLLVDRKLGPMRDLVDILAQAGASELRDLMLRGLGDVRTLEMILDAVPDDSDKLPPEYVRFLPLLGVGAALDKLQEKLTEGRRSLLTKLILARLPREADLVVARLGHFAPETTRVLGEAVVSRVPERAAEVVRQLVAHREEALRVEGLYLATIAPRGAIPLRPLCGLLEDRAEAVRVRAAEVLGTIGDESVADALCAALSSGRGVSLVEADALGRALGRVAPRRAASLFPEWLEPKGGFLRRLSSQTRVQQWAAIAGYGVLPGEEPENVLRLHAARNDGDVRRHCHATLARRRKEGERRG